MPRARSIIARIAAHIVHAPNGCWICDLELRAWGPTIYVVRTGPRPVRRFMVGRHRGRPLTRSEVVRACPQDERCVNPAHLPVLPAAVVAEANRRARITPCEPNGWEILAPRVTTPAAGRPGGGGSGERFAAPPSGEN